MTHVPAQWATSCGLPWAINRCLNPTNRAIYLSPPTPAQAKAQVRRANKALREQKSAAATAASEARHKAAVARGARVPENPRMTYAAYLKALQVRERLVRERADADKAARADARREVAAKRAGQRVRAEVRGLSLFSRRDVARARRGPVVERVTWLIRSGGCRTRCSNGGHDQVRAPS